MPEVAPRAAVARSARRRQGRTPARRHPPAADYARLAAVLQRWPRRTATLTFTEIERTLGELLALDAYERRSWWMTAAAGPSPRIPGWRVVSVDVLGRLVTFARVD